MNNKLNDLFNNDKLKEKFKNMKLEKEYKNYQKERNKSIKEFLKKEEKQTISDFLKQDKKDSINEFRKSQKKDYKENNKFFNQEKNKGMENNKLIEKKNKKINIENLKEIALVGSAIVLVGIGYVNFSKNPQTNLENTLATSSNNIGDVQFVSGDAVLVENDSEELIQNSMKDSKMENNEALLENSEFTSTNTVIENDNIQNKDNKNIEENNNIGENIVETATEGSNNGTKSNKEYFTELRLNRDDLYSQKIDTYQKIIDSTSISSEQKSIAVQEIDKLTTQKNSISVAEELIRLKGFEDVVIYVNEESVSVIVRIAVLSLEQVAQVQNIVSRELNVEVKNINISNK